MDTKIEKKLLEFVKAVSNSSVYNVVSEMNFDIDVNIRTLCVFESDDCNSTIEENVVNETGEKFFKLWSPRMNFGHITPSVSEKAYAQLEKLFKKKWNAADIYTAPAE